MRHTELVNHTTDNTSFSGTGGPPLEREHVQYKSERQSVDLSEFNGNQINNPHDEKLEYPVEIQIVHDHSQVRDDGLGSERQSQNSHLLGVRPYIYKDDDSEPKAPTHRGSPIPAKYGGRSTPVAHRYQSQVFSNESNSYLTATDGPARSHTTQSYVAVNPFAASLAQSLVNIGVHSSSTPLYPVGYCRPPTPVSQSYAGTADTLKYVLAFFVDTMPRQVYLHLLLRLPSLYFTRVTRIFEDAELSMPDIRRMAMSSTNDWKKDTMNVVQVNWNFDPSVMPPSFANLKASWENFIDSLLMEWKTLNIVSVLLLSAILTTLQLEGAATHPIIRYSALMSLVCALLSLLYGCLYIIRFGTMRKTHKAAEWAAEAQKTRTHILWNVWVLLATPSIWLSWSIIFYLICIISFIWLTGPSNDPIILSPQMSLGPRIAITIVFVIGLVYFFLITITFSRYGDAMDRAWRNRVLGWAEHPGSSSYKAASSIRPRASMEGSEHNTPSSVAFPLPRPSSHPELRGHYYRPQGVGIINPGSVALPFDAVIPASFSRPPPDPPRRSPSFRTVKVLDLRFKAHILNEMPQILLRRDIGPQDWRAFISDVSQAWDGQYPLYQTAPGMALEHNPIVGRSRPQDVVARSTEWWNERFFRPRGAQAVLCQEVSPYDSHSPSYAIYLLDLTSQTFGGDDADALSAGIVERFGSVPEGLDRIDVFDPPDPANNGRPSGKTVIFAGPHEARVHWRRGSTIAQSYDNSIRTASESQGSLVGRDSTSFEINIDEDDEPEPVKSEDDL